MVLNLSAKWLMAVLSAYMGIGLRETRTKIRTVGLCLKTSHTERNTMAMDMHLERLGSWILIMHPSECHPWNRFSTKLFDRNLFIINRTLLCHFWQKKIDEKVHSWKHVPLYMVPVEAFFSAVPSVYNNCILTLISGGLDVVLDVVIC